MSSTPRPTHVCPFFHQKIQDYIRMSTTADRNPSSPTAASRANSPLHSPPHVRCQISSCKMNFFISANFLQGSFTKEINFRHTFYWRQIRTSLRNEDFEPRLAGASESIVVSYAWSSQLNGKPARCGAVPHLPYDTRLFRVQADLILRRQIAGIWKIPGMHIVQQAVSGMTQAQIYNDQ